MNKTDMTEGPLTLELEYKTGGYLRISGATEEQMVFLANLGVKVLWGKNADALSLNDMKTWLGWSQ